MERTNRKEKARTYTQNVARRTKYDAKGRGPSMASVRMEDTTKARSRQRTRVREHLERRTADERSTLHETIITRCTRRNSSRTYNSRTQRESDQETVERRARANTVDDTKTDR